MILDNLIGYAARMPEIALAGAIFVFWLAALWLTINLITKFDDNDEIIRRDNRAYAVSRGSLVAAHAIALTFSITDYTYQPGVFIQWEFLGWMMTEGLYIYLVLLLSRPIVDRLVLWKANNLALLREGNLAVGFAEAGAYLGIGVMLGSSLVGSAAGGLWLTIVSSFVFYCLGIAWQFAGFWVHEAITRYSMRERLIEGRASTGLETGGLLLAMSLAVSPAVAGDLDGWGLGVALFVLVAVCSFLLLYPIWLLLRTFGPGRSLHDSNDAGSGLAGSIVNSIMVVMLGFCVNQLITVML